MRPGSLLWFARHEARLSWREAMSLVGGRRGGRRSRGLIIGIVFFAIIMHLLALGLVSRYTEIGTEGDAATLTMISAIAVVSWSLMLSQAMEAVTRAFYARADFDLILSSPAQSKKLFAVRIVSVAFSTMSMALVLTGPFINVLAYRGGFRWLGGYGLMIAMGFSATAIGIALSVFLFRWIGPRLTRFVSQIAAAVIGAGFVIGLQLAAITSFGSPNSVPLLESKAFQTWLPDEASLLWTPARAALGEIEPLIIVLGVAILALGAVIGLFAGFFGRYAISAAGLAEPRRRKGRAASFRQLTVSQALRRKEWMLLRRDPWLASQTLMQLLYLLPPAFLLWRNLGSQTSSLALVGPVLVMAAGQLAGGLAWLAVSGEDAPELVATAPATPRQVTRAKIEAVIACIAILFTPLLLALSINDPVGALLVAGGIIVAATSATLIQLWYRRQAKRSQFRRRETSSRLTTIAEAIANIGWAGATGLAANGSRFAVPAAAFAAIIVLGVFLASPRGRADSDQADGSHRSGRTKKAAAAA